MNRKIYKFLILFSFIFLSFITNINSVSAASTGSSYNCDNEPYECISCKFTIKSPNNLEYVYTYYAKSDANGNVSLAGEGDSMINASLDNGYFSKFDTRSNKYKLSCPNMYYQFQVGTGYDGKYALTYTKLADFNYQGATYKSTLVIPIKSTNGKPFASDEVLQNITSCDIPIMYEYNISQNDSAYAKSNYLANVTISNGIISVSKLQEDMKLKDNPISSTISTSNFSEGCPNDIIVFCKKTNNPTDAYKYECSLNKATDVEVSSSGLQYYQIDNPTGLNNLFRLSSYDITCDDVEQLHIIWIMLWVGAPILLIIMGTVDYFRAIISGDAETMKKVKKKFPKRIVALIALIFTPAVITIIVNIVQSNKKSDLGKTSDVSLMYCIVNGNK